MWKPGNLNIIIGPNASGKSNILRLLELIQTSVWGMMEDIIQNSGGMLSILWDGQDRDLAIIISLSEDSNELKATISYSLELKRIGKSNAYTIFDEAIAHILPSNHEDDWTVPRILHRRSTDAFYSDDDDEKVELQGGEILSSSETLLSRVRAFPKISILIDRVAQNLNNYEIYPELRLDQLAPVRQPVVSRFEERLDPDGQNLTSVLHTVYESDLAFQENIDRAMTAAFGDDYRGLAFPPAGTQRVELSLRWKSLSRPQPAAVLSDGTLRFLFLITALSLPKLPSLICIDEPETGLHPSMLPIIAEYAANAAQRTQVVLTTHSVQFLDAFSEYNPTTTVAQLKDGETKLVTLDGEKLAYWLREYSLGALFGSGELENMAQDALEEEEEAGSHERESVGEDAE
ncbi:chromosome segregation protein SMC [Capsulimonas corticalis]|uniref:Chromosome segregation protein SMC n=1 Tax=Capsulimonas corticalis TaxID=2219043 RepID=A0A9N7QG84_9BACT|nr:chromosome segregation protein SMC [Capsulimonas corticalis]